MVTRVELEERLADTQHRLAVLSALEPHLPEYVKVVAVRQHHGTVAAICVGDPAGAGVPATWARAVLATQQLPPVSVTLIRKEGSRAFVPTAHAKAHPEILERAVDVSEVSPVRLIITPISRHGAFIPRLQLRWFASTPAGLILVQVFLGLPPRDVLDVKLQPKNKPAQIVGAAGFFWTPGAELRLSVDPVLNTIRGGESLDNEVVAMRSEVRRGYSDGSYPPDLELHFDDVSEGLDPAKVGAAIVEYLANAAAASAAGSTTGS